MTIDHSKERKQLQSQIFDVENQLKITFENEKFDIAQNTMVKVKELDEL